MSNYVQTTFFAPKDSLPTSNPAKTIFGAQFDVEFGNIASAIASKLGTTYSQGGSGSINRSITGKLSETLSVTDFGADPLGISDSTADINAAIAALGATGGIVMFPPGTYLVSGPITQSNYVSLRGYGATINYTGSGVILASPSTGALIKAGAYNFVINGGTGATTFLQVNSGYSCTYTDLLFLGDSLTSTCVSIGFNTTGTPNPIGGGAGFNSVQNYFENIAQAANGSGKGCGTFISIAGNSSSSGIATDNTFVNVQAQTVNVVGIIGTQWGDSNIWSGMCRIGLNGSLSPANGIGINIGSAGAGIYSWTMEHVAIDTFGTPAVDNRAGVQINAANSPKNIHIGVLFMGPQNEQNALIATNVLSYDITVAPRTTSNYQSKHLVGTNLGIGVPANTAATVIAGAGAWVTGATQYVFFAQGSAINQGSPVLGVSFGSQPGGVASASPYTIAQVMGFYCAPGANGTNATVTNAYAFYTADQNFGTNNYGFVSNLVAGAGKWAFYGAGTASSFFGGPIVGPLSINNTVGNTTVFTVTGNLTSPTVQGYGPTFAGLVDMTPDKSTFTITYLENAGGTTLTTGTAIWQRNGNQVTMVLPAGTGTSAHTDFTASGIPAALQPTHSQNTPLYATGLFTNNSAAAAGVITINTNGTLTFGDGALNAAWTASGQKGVAVPVVMTYLLN